MKIGIDIGGSHIGVGLFDDKGEKLLVKKEVDILKEDKLKIEEFLIKNIVKLINKILEDRKLNINDIELIGIAAPGLVKKGVIIKSKNLNLSKFPICVELSKYFRVPIILRNDCKCAALAERKFGNLKSYSNCLFISVGTGIGGAAFINGKLLETSRTTGFGMGHCIIKINGKECTCGKKGCFEAYASIGSLKREVQKALKLNEKLTGKVLIELLKDEELSPILDPIKKEYISNLSIGISNLINIFGPEAIILGGSLVFYEDMFLEEIKDDIRKNEYLYNNEFFPKIIMAKLKNDAGMIGATIEK